MFHASGQDGEWFAVMDCGATWCQLAVVGRYAAWCDAMIVRRWDVLQGRAMRLGAVRCSALRYMTRCDVVLCAVAWCGVL